jgi:hypothetical protein
MRKIEMQSDLTYIVCPEKTCRLFWDTTRSCPCDGNCPYERQQKLIIICHNCREMIVLPGGTSRMLRIDHACKGKSGVAGNFRMSGRYRLIYEAPTE